MYGVLLGAAYVASSRMHFPWHSPASPRPVLRLGLGLWLGQATFIGHFTWQPHMNFHRNCKQNFYTHANSPAALCKIITKKGKRREREIKAEDLRGQGCVCICPENRVGVWVFWGLVHYRIVGWAWCIPCCRISCRFAIKMLSMPKNYAMLWHPSGQSTIYMRIQFDFQYS